ncbi:MAG: 50S ribosomal protein L22 [Acidimicrobiaceae bacterium]|nr:50S ribosomal protein L22 [Acidimicrobiaceae bacterium]|tara:strand:- start:441 stop:1292 length:852 start_codon:yes stop_codon:yes gene_type:complete
MTATKTNERPGTRAQLKYVRSSAYKVREVLNLIRGKSFFEATNILTFSERRISDTVLKCLNSAAANAENNDDIPVEELFVSACYADEGPTLKRWRPRARGRATRIRKRTCHITLILGRYSSEELTEQRERAELKGNQTQQSAAESRKRRVAKSKESELESQPEEVQSDEDPEAIVDEVEETPSEQEEIAEKSDTESEDTPYGEGSTFALEDGSAPSSDFTIKAKVSTKIYHPEESSFFGRTKADVWFTNAETAEAAGFRLPNSMQKDNDETEENQDDNDGENE